MSSKSRSRSCTSEVGSVPADRPDAALIALGHAFIADQDDHDDLVERWARTLQARAEYRDDRVKGIAGRLLCTQRRHRTPGLRGCADCRAEVLAAWEPGER